MTIRPNVSSTGARSGHPERWDLRGPLKGMARTARRHQDAAAIAEGLDDEADWLDFLHAREVGPDFD